MSCGERAFGNAKGGIRNIWLDVIREGWFLPEYADLVRGDLKTTIIPER
jgi:hypothetical protein